MSMTKEQHLCHLCNCTIKDLDRFTRLDDKIVYHQDCFIILEQAEIENKTKKLEIEME